ncbi:MAG: hypothetical protein ACT4QE_11190 [Anaerolineales bacterium]
MTTFPRTLNARRLQGPPLELGGGVIPDALQTLTLIDASLHEDEGFRRR